MFAAKRACLGSLRGRLLLLVVLAVTPALALLGFTALEQRRTTLVQIESSALAVARSIAAEQQDVIEGGHQLLIALAQLPVRDALATNTFAIGDYQTGRVTGKPTLTFGYPVTGPQGRPVAAMQERLDGVLHRRPGRRFVP